MSPEALVQHGPYLRNVAYRLVKNEADAADVVQQTYLSALIHGEGFRAASSPKTWLTSIAMRKAFDVLRLRKRQEIREDDGAVLDQIPAVRFPADALVREGEVSAALDRALGALTPRQREVFLLREADGMSYSEIGVRLGLQEQCLRVHYFRARQVMRARLMEAA